ncbi:MAG: NTPase [Solirubrobacteraceae bacterium]
MAGTRANPPRLLLEGRPGAGKTTVAVRLIEILRADGVPVTGFVTREVRGERGRRVGFEIETVDGRHGLLAHVDLRGGPRVGRYGVALEDLERVAVPLLERADSGSIVVVDELGKMELASAHFRDAVAGVLARPLPLVATVHAFGHPFTDAVKRVASVTVVPVTRGNRDALAPELAAHVRSWAR